MNDFEPTLKTAYRDIRVTGQIGPNLSRPVTVARSAEFVQRLLDKHRGTVSRQEVPLRRVYQRLAYGWIVQQPVQESHVRVAPQIAIHFVEPFQAATQSGSAMDSAAVEQQDVLLRRMETVLDRQRRTQVTVNRLTERLVTRSGRIEQRVIRRGDVVERPGTLRMSAVPREVVRRLIAPADVQDTTTGAQMMAPPSMRQTAPPQADVDVNQITEAVIRAIDRRIIAQRERLGRG